VTYRALVAVLTVVRDPAGLRDTFASLCAQGDTRWQWCVVVSGDAPEGTFDAVQTLIADEPRAVAVRAETGKAAILADLALQLAQAETVAWLDGGDRLDAATFGLVRERLAGAPWVYTDEADLDPDGEAVDIWFKPDYAPELLRSQPYALRLAVLPLQMVRAVGGFRSDAGTAAWYDLVLRVATQAPPPAHLAGPFYLHGRRGDGAPYVADHPLDRCRVVARALEEAGEVVEVSPIDVQGRPVGQRVRRILERHPRISLVVPTKGTTSIVHGIPRCHIVELVRSVWVPGRYPDLELVVVHDLDTPEAALDEVTRITEGAAVFVPFRGPFNFSRKCNVGALAATGEYLCFLNDDVEVITPDWLDELASLLADPTVGAVGPRLLFADGSLQHAGHLYDGAWAHHFLFRRGSTDLDLGAMSLVTGERSGVTAACMLMRFPDFLRVGGFCDALPLSFNDVDMSLKVRQDGLRILYTPHASLFHFESQSRIAEVIDEELRKIRLRWLPSLQADPYLNPLLRTPPDDPLREKLR
jgi:GT2 family glycosyltransferase